MQSSQLSKLPPNKGEVVPFEAISLIVIAVIIFVQWIGGKLWGWIFGGPAGSGGKFREAAKDTRDQLRALWLQVEQPLIDLETQAPERFPEIVEQWQQSLGRVYDIQDKAWQEYEGRNLLGATFFGGWTNAMIQKDHMFILHKVQSRIVRNNYNDLNTKIYELDKKVERIDVPPHLRQTLSDLLERMDRVDSVLQPEVSRLLGFLPGLFKNFDILVQRFLAVESGRTGETDPHTKTLVLQLTRVMGEMLNVTIPVGAGTPHNQLVALLSQYQQMAVSMGNFIAQTRLEFAQYPLAFMQRDLRRIQQQANLIPGILQAIKTLQNQVSNIVTQQIPQIRKQLNDQISKQEQDRMRLQSQLTALHPLNLHYWIPFIRTFFTDLPEWREDIIKDACKRCSTTPPPPPPPPLTCKKILELLCECRDSADPAIKALWKCILKEEPDDDEEIIKAPLPGYLRYKMPRIQRTKG